MRSLFGISPRGVVDDGPSFTVEGISTYGFGLQIAEESERGREVGE